MKRIVCVGDAVTRGARATRGYPEHLWEQLRADGREVFVQNAGLPRGALVDVLRGLPEVFAGQRYDTLVLLSPPYDARGGGTNPRELRTLLEQAVALGGDLLQRSSAGGRIILCSPTPIGERATVRGFGRPARRWVPRAAKIVQAVAHDHEIAFVALHEMDRALLADAVHPKPEGYKWIAAQVRAALAGAAW